MRVRCHPCGITAMLYVVQCCMLLHNIQRLVAAAESVVQVQALKPDVVKAQPLPSHACRAFPLAYINARLREHCGHSMRCCGPQALTMVSKRLREETLARPPQPKPFGAYDTDMLRPLAIAVIARCGPLTR